MLSPESNKKVERAAGLPSVEDLLSLQKHVVLLGKGQKKLRGSTNADNAHLIMPKEIDGFEMAGNRDEDRYWSHRFTGRVARTSYRLWSMRIVEIFWIKQEESGANAGHRTSYQFEWTNKNVLLAARYIHAYTQTPPESRRENYPRLFNDAIDQFESVSSGDCELLATEMSAFRDASNLVHYQGVDVRPYENNLFLYKY